MESSGYAVARPTKYCHTCGGVIDAAAIVCPRCGVIQPSVPAVMRSEKLILPAFLLCFLFGVFGAHRFYVGRIGTGILQLVTLGGLGIWALVDLVMIIVGAFKDKDGEKLVDWT